MLHQAQAGLKLALHMQLELVRQAQSELARRACHGRHLSNIELVIGIGDVTGIENVEAVHANLYGLPGRQIQ